MIVVLVVRPLKEHSSLDPFVGLWGARRLEKP